MRVAKNDYIMDWEVHRQAERDALLAKGKRPYKTDLDQNEVWIAPGLAESMSGGEGSHSPHTHAGGRHAA